MYSRPSILFLIDVLYSTRGGAEGVLWRITHSIPKTRFRCVVATFASEPDRVVSQDFDCPVHCFPLQCMYDLNSLRMAVRLSRLIRAEQFSIVHSFFPAADLLGGLVAKLSGCPIIISSRRDMGFQRSLPQRLAYRVGRNLFDQVQAVGEEVRAFHVQADHLRPERVVTVYNGVDLNRIDQAPAIETLPGATNAEDRKVIVCVANIRRIKALEVFLRSAAIVCRQAPQSRFLVIGAVNDAACFRELMQLAWELQIQDKITFCGPSSDVPSLLKRCDVFCLLSRSEGLSNATIEAMACGLPCVVTAVGGNTELIEHGLNGYLVPVDSAETAAAAVLRLLSEPDRAKAMGQAGRRIVEAKFSLDQMITRMLDQYDILLSQSGRAVGTGRFGVESVQRPVE